MARAPFNVLVFPTTSPVRPNRWRVLVGGGAFELLQPLLANTTTRQAARKDNLFSKQFFLVRLAAER